MYKITGEKRAEILAFYQKYNKYYEESSKYDFLEFELGATPATVQFLQLYSYFNAIDEAVHPYYSFFEYLCSKHPNLEKKKILDVASGYIPAISNIIASHKKLKQPIVAMDPKALPLNIKNVTIKREAFTVNTDISPYDLIIATFPCDLINILIPKLVINRKEFSIQMCRCKLDGSKFLSRTEWMEFCYSVYAMANNLTNYGFEIEQNYIDLSYLIDVPIITARKRER